MGRRDLGLLAALGLTAAACAPSAAAAPGPPPTFVPFTTFAVVSTTTPTVAPWTTSSPTLPPEPIEAPKTQLVVSGTGDVNLDPRFVCSFLKTGYEDTWTGLLGAFLRDDLAIVNLECSPSNLGKAWAKPYTFRCDPEALPSMAAAGVDVASLATTTA